MQLLHTTMSTHLSIDAESTLAFQLVTEIAALRSLSPEWQGLLEQGANAEPMRSPAWLLNWWDVYGGGRELRVGVFREADQLVGLIPLCKRRHWYRPGIPFERLEFLGADVVEGDGPCSEYLGPLVQTRYEQAVVKSFVQQIHRSAFGPWHEIVFSAMNGNDPLGSAFANAFTEAGDCVETQSVTTAPYLNLPLTWDAYLKSLDRKKRYNITRALRDFEAWAGADWTMEEARTPDQLAQGQAILRALHDQRWRDDGASAGAYASSRFTAFHREVIPRLLGEGKLDLFWLTVRGEPVAVHYQILANRKAYFYQCGRKMDVPANLRIGIVMVALAIQRAIKQGLHEFDFLGGPSLYKMQLTDTTRPIVQLRIAQPGIRESLRHRAEHAIDWARGIRNRFRASRKPTSASANLS